MKKHQHGSTSGGVYFCCMKKPHTRKLNSLAGGLKVPGTAATKVVVLVVKCGKSHNTACDDLEHMLQQTLAQEHTLLARRAALPALRYQPYPRLAAAAAAPSNSLKATRKKKRHHTHT